MCNFPVVGLSEPDWNDLLNKLQSDIDNSNAHSFRIQGNNLSGPGDLCMFRFFRCFSTLLGVHNTFHKCIVR